MFISVATDFDRRDSSAKLPDGWQAKALRDLDRLGAKSPEDIEFAATDDHAKYFSRVDVDFGKTAGDVLAKPTRERLARIKKGAHDDPDLIETYFQYGRYLLIACSRPGCFPANLQGVWNPRPKAPWGSDYHLNGFVSSEESRALERAPVPRLLRGASRAGSRRGTWRLLPREHLHARRHDARLRGTDTRPRR